MTHTVCGHTYEVRPNSFKKGSRCPKCYGNIKKSHEDFLIELSKCVDLEEYKPIDKYKNNRTPIRFYHRKCNNIYDVTPYKILTGARCPYCQGYRGQDYKKRCQEKLGEDYIVKNQPKRHVDKVFVTHLKCKNEYQTTCNKILQGRGCPYCKTSKMELEVRGILKRMDYCFYEQYTFSDCRDILPLRFDFIIKLNDSLIAIECQGRQHYERVDYFGDFEGVQRRDNIKREYCKNNNIKLIEIPYWEKDIEMFIMNEVNK